VAHPAEDFFLSMILGLYNAASALLYKWVPLALLARIVGKTPKHAAVRKNPGTAENTYYGSVIFLDLYSPTSALFKL
jgi:hypothetical protein